MRIPKAIQTRLDAQDDAINGLQGSIDRLFKQVDRLQMKRNAHSRKSLYRRVQAGLAKVFPQEPAELGDPNKVYYATDPNTGRLAELNTSDSNAGM